MEQTSSSAYPNILVVDYVKKARVASPALLAETERYLSVGYQKLLTFERPGGGFDWWGNGPPLVWLSAYGLQEFNDMAKVYPIDKGVITRTQAWLMGQQAASRPALRSFRPSSLRSTFVSTSNVDSSFAPQAARALAARARM